MAVYSKMNSIKPRDQVIQEAYFGKTPELQEAERILGEWRSKYYGSGNRFVTAAAADPLFYEFCDKMADIFGFAEYSIILKGDLVANSMTYPTGYTITGNTSKIIKTKNGYKYDGTPIMVQICFPYVLFDPSYSDAEIMAICLHEIGHNFSHKADTVINIHHILKLFRFAIIMMLCVIINPGAAILNALVLTNEGKRIYKHLSDSINSTKMGAFAFSFIQLLIGLPTTIFYNIYAVLNRLAPLSRYVEISLETLFKTELLDTVSGIKDERISDNFATIYGYGPELYTALRKLDANGMTVGKIIHKLPVIGWINDLIEIPQTWIMTLGDPHPTTISRRRAQINYLEAEMKKDGLSPNARKMILQDLRQFDEDLLNIEKQAKKLGGTAVMDTYHVLLSKLKHGDDPRELFFSYDNDVEKLDKLGESTTIDTSIIDNVDLL